MLFRAFAAATALLVPTAVTPQTADYIAFNQYPLIHQVSCREGSGTAFRVGPRHFYSVAHVTALHQCKVDGKPIKVTEQDGLHDFSQFDVDLPARKHLGINCTGFIPGHWYWSVGYAFGAPFQTSIALYATAARDGNGRRVLLGQHTVIPGMSGGPIFDEVGRVVGLVNAYIPGSPISLSRELRDTDACGADIA